MAKIDLLTPGRQELGQVTIPCPQASLGWLSPTRYREALGFAA